MQAVAFKTVIQGGATKDVAGIVVPAEVMTALDAGQRPRVQVTVNGYTYDSSIGKMGDQHLIPLSADHRRVSGLLAGLTVDVRLVVQAAPPPLSVPADLQQSLVDHDRVAAFDSAAPSRRKEWVRQVTSAKAPETRARRILAVIAALTNDAR
jgi:hypothetical protein